MNKTLAERSKYILKDQLHDLKPGEEVIFTVDGGKTYQEMMVGKQFTSTELARDERFLAAWQQARQSAVQIMTGPEDRYDDHQGLFDRVRVVPAKHSITGTPDLGWTLIGVRKGFLIDQ